MSCAVVIRRVHAVLAALAVLAFIAAMAVASPPAHAVPLLGEDNKLIITIDMKVTVKSDDTFEASFVITDQTNYSLVPPITKNSCTLDYFLVEPNIFAHAETTFVDGKDKRVCTITTKGKISETNGTIRRKTPSPELQLFYAATFPGEVTQSQGGKVEGEEKNTVSFTDFKGRIVKGKDRPASETTTSKVLPWIIEGVGSLVVIGLIAMAVVVRRRQRSGQGAPGAAMQAVPVPGPEPQSSHLGQPVPQQYPGQPVAPQPNQQHPGQPSPLYSPSSTANYPHSPTQAPQQHGTWPPQQHGTWPPQQHGTWPPQQHGTWPPPQQFQ